LSNEAPGKLIDSDVFKCVPTNSPTVIGVLVSKLGMLLIEIEAQITHENSSERIALISGLPRFAVSMSASFLARNLNTTE